MKAIVLVIILFAGSSTCRKIQEDLASKREIIWKITYNICKLMEICK